MQVGRRSKWLLLLLTFVGSSAVAAGLFVAVLTMTRTPADHEGIELPGTMYVGANTCFTCHKDQEHNWSEMLSAELITSPLANPQSAVLDVNVRTEVAPLIIGGTTASESAPFADWRESQSYIIAVDDGAVGSNAPTVETSPMPQSSDCEDCDATPQTSEDLSLNALDVTCTVCHSRHVRIAGASVWAARAQYG